MLRIRVLSPTGASLHAMSTNIGLLVFDGVESSSVERPQQVWASANRILSDRFDNRHRVGSTRLLATPHDRPVLSRDGVRLAPETAAAAALDPHTLWISDGDVSPLLDDYRVHAQLRAWHGSAAVTVAVGSGVLLAAAAGLLHQPVAATAVTAARLESLSPGLVTDHDSPIVDGGAVITSRAGEELQVALHLLRRVAGSRLSSSVAAALGAGPPSGSPIPSVTPLAGEGLI